MHTNAAYTVDGLVTARADGSGLSAQAAWWDWCSDVHGEFEMHFGDAGYRGSVRRQATAAYSLVSWTSDAESLRRVPQGIRADPRGKYEILFPISRPLFVGVDGLERPLVPGEIAIVPSDRPFAIAHDDATSALTLLAPMARVDQRLTSGMRRRDYRSSGRGLVKIARDLLVSAVREHSDLTAFEFDAACDRAIDLICLALNGEDRSTAASAMGTVVVQVLAYVRAHASEPDLSLADIAASVGWSVRYVQAALARDGLTATEMIRAERLALARARLEDPSFAHHSIEWVAHSVGFTSASAFGKAYRRAFGMVPRDARRPRGGTDDRATVRADPDEYSAHSSDHRARVTALLTSTAEWPGTEGSAVTDQEV